MQYRFRYQPRNGSRVILDVPARAEVALAFDEDRNAIDFDVVRIYLNEVELVGGTGLHEDVHDYLCNGFAADIRRNLARAGENATAIHRAIA